MGLSKVFLIAVWTSFKGFEGLETATFPDMVGGRVNSRTDLLYGIWYFGLGMRSRSLFAQAFSWLTYLG